MARRTVRLYWGLYTLLLLLIVALGCVALWYRFGVVPALQSSLQPAEGPRSLVNAVWMEHAWVDEGKSREEIRDLAGELKDKGFTDVFFHVGPLEGDGSIPTNKYLGAKSLLTHFKVAQPGLRVQAWMGQVTTSWGGPLDLTKEATRAQIVRTAETMLDLGFDGVHLNLEPVLDEDKDFLSLLSDLREVTHARKKLLSVASDDVEPFLGAGFLVRSCCGEVTFWRPAYLAKVFGFVDQVAVMTYDSSLKDPLLYSWYVSLMTERLATLVPEGKILFVGIPSFETGNKFFDPKVENIRSGLTGVIAGLPKTARKEALGVALYAYWETSREEWDAYAAYWLGKRP